MPTTEQDAATLEAAVSSVLQFSLHALKSEDGHWDKHVSLLVAQAVWNACSGGADRVCELALRFDCEDLTEYLTHLHRSHWPTADFLIGGLEACEEDGRLVFRFDLTWDEFVTIRTVRAHLEPCGCGEPECASEGGCAQR